MKHLALALGLPSLLLALASCTSTPDAAVTDAEGATAAFCGACGEGCACSEPCSDDCIAGEEAGHHGDGAEGEVCPVTGARASN